MRLIPSKVRVIVKKQPHDENIRVEAKIDKEEGRKVFSFTLYDTDLDEVMKTLISTFEKETKQRFPNKIKSELGIVVNRD